MTRGAGRYVLTGASYGRDGEQFITGDVVELSAEDAERLAKAFEPAGRYKGREKPESKSEES